MLHGSQGRRPPTLTVGEARARVCSAAALSASPLNQQSAQGLTLGKEWLLSQEAAQGKGGNYKSGAYSAHLEVRRLHWGPKWVPRWETVVQVSLLDQQFHNKPGISWKKAHQSPRNLSHADLKSIVELTVLSWELFPVQSVLSWFASVLHNIRAKTQTQEPQVWDS